MVVNVVMTSYFTEQVPEREEYARESVRSLVNNLSCEENLRLIVADDSLNHQDIVDELVETTDSKWIGSCFTHSYHHGIGASLNKALMQVSNDGYWVYTCDDWFLEVPLNLDGPLTLLRKLDYDLVRLGPIHPGLTCLSRFQVGLGYWLDLLPHYGGFAFSTRPFIATKNFYNKMGPFDENLNSYETERLYAERIAKSTCKLAYWGSINLNGPFTHLGLEAVGYMDIPS